MKINTLLTLIIPEFFCISSLNLHHQMVNIQRAKRIIIHQDSKRRPRVPRTFLLLSIQEPHMQENLKCGQIGNIQKKS